MMKLLFVKERGKVKDLEYLDLLALFNGDSCGEELVLGMILKEIG